MKCTAWKKNRKRCKAEALPGKKVCMAHARSLKIKAKREEGAPKAGGPEAFLHKEERESFKDLISALTREIRPKSMGDSILIERFATAVLHARRCDVAAKEGQKGAGRDVYFADLRVMNLATKLGISRNFRLRRADAGGGRGDGTSKHAWLLNGPSKVLQLDRGNGQSNADKEGFDT